MQFFQVPYSIIFADVLMMCMYQLENSVQVYDERYPARFHGDSQQLIALLLLSLCPLHIMDP